MKKFTKEEIIELMSMAAKIEESLRAMGRESNADEANKMIYAFKCELNEICGDEYVESIKESKKHIMSWINKIFY